MLLSDFSTTWKRKQSQRQLLAAEVEVEVFMEILFKVGFDSRAGSIKFLAHEELYADFETFSAEDIGDYDALRELVYLYNHWQQLALWIATSQIV